MVQGNFLIRKQKINDERGEVLRMILMKNDPKEWKITSIPTQNQGPMQTSKFSWTSQN